MTVAVILLIFYEVSSLTIAVAGLGLGLALDSFISSLFPSLNRAGEKVKISIKTSKLLCDIVSTSGS